MEKFTNEELLDVLPSSLRESKELTTKQKVILGQLVVYNGLEIVKKDGYFYRSNKDLCSDCDVQEKTLITALNKLVMLGFIERKSGSRKDGASLYRLNQKLITDYCKTKVDDYSNKDSEDNSNNYSKIITAMHVRITELELTVKTLVDRITVIEGKNYSTETDIDKEIDKEKELNNNILIEESNYSLNNIEETDSNQELEIEDSEESDSELQLALGAIPTEIETSGDEQITSPTDVEKQLLRQCNELINPYLVKVQSANSKIELSKIKGMMVQTVNDYINSVDGMTQWVVDYLNARVKDYLAAREKDIEEMRSEQIANQLTQLDQYASYYR